MQKDAKQEEQLSAEIQDVMKFLISAFRIVKLYPPNNPIYSQSLAKAFETLSHFLETTPEYRMGVQKTYLHVRTDARRKGSARSISPSPRTSLRRASERSSSALR